MMKKIAFLFPLLLLLLACNGIQVSEKLDHVDSLIVKEQYDSASELLKDVADGSMTAEDQAHSYLLKTQLGYLTKQPLSSDSLLDIAIIYYNKVDNYQKLADAYYFKSYRSEINQNYTQAILYGKEAERLAMKTNDYRTQYKIAESLSFLNGLCENDLLQLQYAKKALSIAQQAQNKSWLAYSYNKISFAFANLGQYDSALVYIGKTIPHLDYVYDYDKTEFLTNIGLLYKENNSEKAKEFFKKALEYGEHPWTLEHLADVYYAEGNKEEAYKLWKRVLSMESRYEKDNLIHSILSYDLEHGNLEEASKNLDKVIAIKDSIINVLRNDTIKDLQLRFDHEVAMHEADKKLISTQRLLLGLVIMMAIMAFYIYYRRKKTEAQEKEYQMQLYSYTTEINQLKDNKDKAQAQIRDLESRKDVDRQRISELEVEIKNAEMAIDDLQKDVKKLLDDKAPKLKKGRVLYDIIMDGGTILRWDRSDDIYFVTYYEAINYKFSNRIRKTKRVARLTPHNTIYLILKDMGKDDNEIMRIMVLTPEGLRSIRMRTRPINDGDS